jgi:hypothetical protein
VVASLASVGVTREDGVILLRATRP